MKPTEVSARRPNLYHYSCSSRGPGGGGGAADALKAISRDRNYHRQQLHPVQQSLQQIWANLAVSGPEQSASLLRAVRGDGPPSRADWFCGQSKLVGIPTGSPAPSLLAVSLNIWGATERPTVYLLTTTPISTYMHTSVCVFVSCSGSLSLSRLCRRCYCGFLQKTVGEVLQLGRWAVRRRPISTTTRRRCPQSGQTRGQISMRLVNSSPPTHPIC